MGHYATGGEKPQAILQKPQVGCCVAWCQMQAAAAGLEWRRFRVLHSSLSCRRMMACTLPSLLAPLLCAVTAATAAAAAAAAATADQAIACKRHLPSFFFILPAGEPELPRLPGQGRHV